MQTKLVPIGNSYGVRLSKSIIKQFDFDKGAIEIVVKKEGILITPVPDTAPLPEWDRLFKEAKKKGFNTVKDGQEFIEWDITLNDGID